MTQGGRHGCLPGAVCLCMHGWDRTLSRSCVTGLLCRILCRLELLLEEKLSLVNKVGANSKGFAATQMRTDAYRQARNPGRRLQPVASALGTGRVLCHRPAACDMRGTAAPAQHTQHLNQLLMHSTKQSLVRAGYDLTPTMFGVQAFDAFLQSFTTYRSILMRVKHEYDAALDDALASVYDNVHMRAELAAVDEMMVSKEQL